MVQWYPHDTGLFTTTSADRTLKVWDTNQMVVVEKFSFTKTVYAHALAASESHSLTAGKVWPLPLPPGVCVAPPSSFRVCMYPS